MEALKRNRPDLFAQLSNGRYAGCEGHAYRVTFSPEAKVYLQVLGMDACRAPVEQALRDAGDAEATLLLEEESAVPAKRDTAAAEQRKAQMFDLFGRENVEIVDE